MRRSFTVRLKIPEGQYVPNIGPFVVLAKSPRGAFRRVRNLFPSMITNHVSQEYAPLECEGVISDRTGLVLGKFRFPHEPYAV